jgi:hypothetical protein
MKALQQSSDGKTHCSGISWFHLTAAGLLWWIAWQAQRVTGARCLWPLILGLARATNSTPYVGARRMG